MFLNKISKTRFRRTRFRLRMLWSRVSRKPLDVRLRLLFNFWAENARGENMERTHLRLAERTIQTMGLCSVDRILDLACGEGLASRLLAPAVSGKGYSVLGLDISDEMLRRACSKSNDLQNLAFVCASAEQIPCKSGFFTKVLSVEAFYYFEHQERVLRELFRVLAPSGWLFLVICHYTDHPESLAFVHQVEVPIHIRSQAGYKAMLQSGGWEQVQAEELLWEPRPGRKRSVHDRALLLRAQKPQAEPFPD
jgi:ubiquinone/menaquinone biosynthesis C-methylase UbiE